MPRSAALPEFLLDRSVGTRALPEALRAHGFAVHTLDDLYGVAGARYVSDEEWLAEAARRHLVVLTKDDRIRRRVRELDALRSGGVRAFVITAGNVTRDALVSRVVDNLDRIVELTDRPGPYIFGLYADGVRLLWEPPQR